MAKSRNPGLSDDMSMALEVLMSGKQPDPARFRVKRHRIWHNIAYAAAGATSFTFFNANKSFGVTNLPQAGYIENETVFRADSLSFELALNTTLTAATGGYAPSTAWATAQAAGTILLNSAEKQMALGCGVVNLKVGDEYIVEDVMGVQNFPAQGGIVTSGVGTFTADDGLAWTTNGTPDRSNRWQMSPYVIFPGRKIEATINYGAAVALTTNAACWFCAIEGWLLTSR